MIFEYYILIILSVELMIYLALRIIWAFTFFIEDEPQDKTEVIEVNSEEFKNVMKEIFREDNND